MNIVTKSQQLKLKGQFTGLTRKKKKKKDYAKTRRRKRKPFYGANNRLE
jgi:hypothetical protein